MDWLGGVAETEFGEKLRLEDWEWWGVEGGEEKGSKDRN